MVEATPRQPFSGYAADLVRVSLKLHLRPGQTFSDVFFPSFAQPSVVVGDSYSSDSLTQSLNDAL